nr:RluA family pseudouridine synthase [Gammaproteobacteria bacterium]
PPASQPTHQPTSQPAHPPAHQPTRQPTSPPDRPPARTALDKPASPSRRLRAGQVVEINAPAAEDDSADVAEAIVLETVWCDDDLLVINKPAGLVVHPGAGNPQHTLMNALLHWWPELKQLPRAGIVHRLDRDTSGLMLVARSERALIHFQQAFKAHTVGRQYLAVVHGTPVAGGTVDAPLARHATRRTQFDVNRSGRPAVTHYRIISRFRDYTAISAFLQTGRTHQIRVHMRHIGYPVVGDPIYGGRRNLSTSLPPALHRLLTRTQRQMLHSWKISFDHPNTGQRHELTTPLPPDVRSRLRALRRYNASS